MMKASLPPLNKHSPETVVQCDPSLFISEQHRIVHSLTGYYWTAPVEHVCAYMPNYMCISIYIYRQVCRYVGMQACRYVGIYLHINLFLYHLIPIHGPRNHDPRGTAASGPASPNARQARDCTWALRIMEGSIAMMLSVKNWVRKSWENHGYNQENHL